MDSFEEYVFIAYGLYIISEERKVEKRKYWIHNVNGANDDDEEEFYTLFGSPKGNRQKYFKYFRMGFFLNLKTLKKCCPQTIKRIIHNGDGE